MLRQSRFKISVARNSECGEIGNSWPIDVVLQNNYRPESQSKSRLLRSFSGLYDELPRSTYLAWRPISRTLGSSWVLQWACDGQS